MANSISGSAGGEPPISRAETPSPTVAALALIAVFGAIDCGHPQPIHLDPAVSLDPMKSEAIVVMAVQPDAALTFLPGQDDGAIWRDDGDIGDVTADAQDGFVVLEIAPTAQRQNYALGHAKFGSGRAFVWKDGAHAPVFRAVPGQVTFVGGLAFTVEGSQISAVPDRSVTLEQVQIFMRRAFPNLPPPVEGEPLRFVMVGEPIAHRLPRREGFLSGGSLGVFGGPAALKPAAAERGGIGTGSSVAITVGTAWRDRVPLTLVWSLLNLSDRRPFSESVVDCTTLSGAVVSCGDPHAEDSTVASGSLLALETGYQHRFRPASWTSLLPAAVFGYLWSVGQFSRGVGCEGCSPSIPIQGVHVGGPYVGASFKMTSNEMPMALTARAEFFARGDLGHRFLLGIELGAP